MKIKVSEATGPVLDWMVAKAAGLKPFSFAEKDVGQQRAFSKWVGINVSPVGHDVYCPSTDWSQGGPIIERERIEIRKCNPLHFPKGNEKGEYTEPLWIAGKMHGTTPLIAAMRCFCASNLGDEVEVPEELK